MISFSFLPLFFSGILTYLLFYFKIVFVLIKIPCAFPTSIPTIGDGLKYFKKLVETNSAGTIRIKIYEPGKLMPAFEIHDAVSTGKVNAGYAVSGYIQGKVPAASLFTAVPFGPPLAEYAAWFYFGNGGKLYEEMYQKNNFNIKPFPLAFLAPETAGWYKKEINSPKDLKGLKIRFFGLGGVVLSKLGASVTTIPGGEIFPALEKGAIDATEFSLPAIDTKLGFYKVAKYNYFPSWHQPATNIEILFNKDFWDKKLSARQRSIIETAIQATNFYTIAQSVSQQGKIVEENAEKHHVKNMVWNKDLLALYKKTWIKVVNEQAAKDPFFKKVWDDLKTFMKNDLKPYASRAYLPRDYDF
jgi:TRAP-type mannitol/chloroaromatic compound transport system substrate-binding protein